MGNSSSRKPVLLFAALCLALIFAGSFLYRAANPSLTVTQQPAMGAGPGPMAEIGNLMTRLEQNPQDLEALNSLGLLFMEMHAWDRAAVFWNRVLSLEPENVSAHYHLGVVKFQLKEYQAAEEHFLKVLAIDPSSHLAHYNLGVLHKYFLEQPEKAQPHFEKVMELAPEDKDIAELVRRELEAGHGQSRSN
jgi:tetratricopeptide (TPR) repeat protein